MGDLYFSCVCVCVCVCARVFPVNIFEPNHHKIKQQGHKKTPNSKPKPSLSPSEIRSSSLEGLEGARNPLPLAIQTSISLLAPSSPPGPRVRNPAHPGEPRGSQTPRISSLPAHTHPSPTPLNCPWNTAQEETKASSGLKQDRPQVLLFPRARLWPPPPPDTELLPSPSRHFARVFCTERGLGHRWCTVFG